MEPTFIAPAERAMYLEYDRQRRQRLSLIINAVFAVLLGVAFIVVAIVRLVAADRLINSAPFAATFFSLPFFVAIFGIGVYCARAGHAMLAALCTVIGSALVSQVFQVVWMFEHGLDPLGAALFGVCLTVIGLAGLLGTRAIMLIVMSVENIYSVVLILAAAPINQGQYPRAITFIVIVACLMLQWGAATLMYAVTTTFRQTLRELGDTRIAYERAKKLDDIKDQFIRSVNHELRTPIMALQGFIDLYLLGETMPPAERTALISEASGVATDLVNLLESILDARRIDQGAADFTPQAVNVREALESSSRMINPREGQMIERELQVRVARDLVAWGEPVRLRQVLTNLLSNAIKYSPPGSPIIVKAGVVAEQPPPRRWPLSAHPLPRHMVEISVRDYGLGIPPDQIPLLFQRFVRLPRDLASTVLGNGLGLYLCRVFVEAMDGHIWVESTGIAGQGSIFYLRLPLPPTTSAEPAPAATEDVTQIDTAVRPRVTA